MYPHIRLGLCCMNITLKYNQDIYSSRSRIFKTIKDKGLEEAKNTAISNLIDFAKILIWGKNHGIEVFRIGSDMIPHASNPDLITEFGKEGEEYMSLEFTKPYLQKIGQLANAENIRLTMHPGQYVQLGSPSEAVYKKSLLDLRMHALIFDFLNAPNDSVMVIHLGGTYGDKQSAMDRFVSRFNQLPEYIKKRIVLENDEKCYDADEVLKICEILNVPMVFDIFHYYCFTNYNKESKQIPISDLLPRILKTWEQRSIRPKFHLSEQSCKSYVGSHSPFIRRIPKELLDIPDKYHIDIDIMIEAKAKELAIGKLYQMYPKLKPPYAKEIELKIPEKAIKDLTVPQQDVDFCENCDKCINQK